MDRLVYPVADLGSSFHALIAASLRTCLSLAATSPLCAVVPANQVPLSIGSGTARVNTLRDEASMNTDAPYRASVTR